jgi:hypothetical protein
MKAAKKFPIDEFSGFAFTDRFTFNRFLSFLAYYQDLSIFWTSSGSCPLCLTPPCYPLEPPETAALFCSVPIRNNASVNAERRQL